MLALASGFGLVMASSAAMAQTAAFPTRPVTIVVPFPAGGATDIVGRLIAEGLSKKWGQSVVVDNRAGAGGNIGSEFVARAAPDGHTLVLGVTGSHGINISLYKKMSYHPLRDFEPLTLATLYPNALVVNPSVPATNLRELVALIKAGKLNASYGSDGNGTASHLGVEMIKQQAGIEMTHVPYRGSAPMLTDLLGGQIPIGMTGLPAVQPYVKSGKLRLIAITTATRFASAPEYPTVAEQGFAGYAAAPWSGFFAPKGTPKAVVDKISADIREIMADPVVKQKVVDAGSEFVPMTPQAFRGFLEKEIDSWAKAVAISGAQVD